MNSSRYILLALEIDVLPNVLAPDFSVVIPAHIIIHIPAYTCLILLYRQYAAFPHPATLHTQPAKHICVRCHATPHHTKPYVTPPHHTPMPYQTRPEQARPRHTPQQTPRQYTTTIYSTGPYKTRLAATLVWMGVARQYAQDALVWARVESWCDRSCEQKACAPCISESCPAAGCDATNWLQL